MSLEPVRIRLGGYGPSHTCFSKALDIIGQRMEQEFGDAVDVKYIYNILDLGYRSEDILWLVEEGFLTLGYQSSSYFEPHVPAIGILDLPFLFNDTMENRAMMDGALGKAIAAEMEARMNYRVLGYFENGLRHVSNNNRPIRVASDMEGMRIRVLPSKIQARTFELLGAEPLTWDLTEAIKGLMEGTIDAQENPLANTATYGAHKFHKYHTLTGHSYISRPIFLHRDSFESMPTEMQDVMSLAVKEAVEYQRDHKASDEEKGRQDILDVGGEIYELTEKDVQSFREAVHPIYEEAKQSFSRDLLDLLPKT